jgi:magnesium transporter
MPIHTPPTPRRHPFETALSHVATRVPVAAPAMRLAEVRACLFAGPFESASHVAVCEGERLVGVLRLEDALAAPADAVVRDVMDVEAPVVAPGAAQEAVAWRAVQHRESALAVVDADGRFRGFVPPHRLLEVLLREHEEDVARLSGFLHDTSAARLTAEEPVARRFWHRAPWLLLGLAGAVAAAHLMETFEGVLQRHVAVAFFIPGLVYLADAVGTQTEALVVRGLSVGVGIGQVWRREVITGGVIGLALAVLFYPIALGLWGEAPVALAVALALLAASTLATAVAMALPALFHALGQDPAFGSGPVATVLQDLLTVLLYLAIASALL